jgi:hypothetical protein
MLTFLHSCVTDGVSCCGLSQPGAGLQAGQKAGEGPFRRSWPPISIAAGGKTVSRKQALETGADIRVERPHSVNGDGYRTARMARNGAVSATTRNSERETRLAG